jgi:hypothetical protein
MPDEYSEELSRFEEELALNNQVLELERRCLTAKRAAQANPADEAAQAAWRECKNERRALRAHWRGIRRYVQDLAVGGDPEAAARVAAEIGAGGSVAAPASMQSGVTPRQAQGG